jgi:RNA polymerase sigma factor (sigma-70 family)
MDDAEREPEGPEGREPTPAQARDFERLIPIVVELAVRRARWVVGEAAAKDIAQNVSIALWQEWQAAPDNFEERTLLEKFVAKAVRTGVKDHLRANRRRERRQWTFAIGYERSVRLSTDTEGQLAERELLRLVKACLLAMPEPQRRAFLLHRQEDWSHEKIGQHLGASARTARRYVALATDELTALVEQYLQEGGR